MTTATAVAAPVTAAAVKQISAQSNFHQLADVLTDEEKTLVKAAARVRAHSDLPTIRKTEHVICFGSFQLFPRQFLLLKDGDPVRIGSRALEMLIALVERSGELISKEDLVARVWPHTFVDRANLTVQVASLRRALGDGRGGNRFLINIPGRGYRFVAPVEVSA